MRGSAGRGSTATKMPFPQAAYPHLQQEGYQDKSPADNRYNCIAWAVEDSRNFWWPSQLPWVTWPKNVPAENTIQAFVLMFEGQGYVSCPNGDLEAGFKKVALYALNGAPKHAARQLPDGRWSSKMGRDIDIEHNTLHALEGPFYGTVVRYFKKAL